MKISKQEKTELLDEAIRISRDLEPYTEYLSPSHLADDGFCDTSRGLRRQIASNLRFAADKADEAAKFLRERAVEWDKRAKLCKGD